MSSAFHISLITMALRHPLDGYNRWYVSSVLISCLSVLRTILCLKSLYLARSFEYSVLMFYHHAVKTNMEAISQNL
jgi:hypothetical protein